MDVRIKGEIKPDEYELEFLDGRPSKKVSGADWIKYGWRQTNWKEQIKQNKAGESK